MKKSFIKKFVSKFLTGVTLFSLVTTIFSSCTDFKRKTPPAQSYDDSSYVDNSESEPLQSEEIVKSKLYNILGENYESYLIKKDKLVRLPCPQNGKPIQVNIEFELNETQKEIIEACLAEYNQVFEIINPNYKFVLNYSPTTEDLSNIYSIDVRKIDSFQENDKGIGHALINIQNKSENIDGYESYNNIITLTKDCLESPQVLMGTFKHEFAHVLGRGDSNNKEISEDTIMDSGEKYGNSLYSKHTSLQTIDVALIDVVYRSLDNIYSDNTINNFINNYEESNIYTFEKYQESKDFDSYRQAIEELDIEKIIENLQNSDYSNDVKNALSETLKKNTVINTNFGSSSGIIAECFNNENNYTYMAWDSNNSISISKRSTNVTSSSYRTISKNNGIIRIGGEYFGELLFEVGDFVLSFDFQKDYLDGKVSLSNQVKNIYQQTTMTKDDYFKYVQEYHINNEQYSKYQ